MKNFRLFINDEENYGFKRPRIKRSKDGVVHTAMFSDFFSKASSNIFFTNEMYANFLNEVIATINIYHPKEKIVLDIYENEESDEEKRELALIGFRSYTNTLFMKKKAEFVDVLLQISFFAIVGIFLIFIIYKTNMKQDFVFYLLQNIGEVLLWQFVGYWAFQYAGQKREMDQLYQVLKAEYSFRRWE